MHPSVENQPLSRIVCLLCSVSPLPCCSPGFVCARVRENPSSLLFPELRLLLQLRHTDSGAAVHGHCGLEMNAGHLSYSQQELHQDNIHNVLPLLFQFEKNTGIVKYFEMIEVFELIINTLQAFKNCIT